MFSFIVNMLNFLENLLEFWAFEIIIAGIKHLNSRGRMILKKVDQLIQGLNKDFLWMKNDEYFEKPIVRTCAICSQLPIAFLSY